MFLPKLHIHFLFLLLLSSVATALHAQTPSQKGKFEVDYVKGCSSLEVTISEVKSNLLGGLLKYRYRQVGYDSSPNESPPPKGKKTFSVPGQYYIVQVENDPGTGDVDIDSLLIEVVAPETPNFQAYICGANQLSIQVNKGMYDYYIAKKSAADPDSIKLEQVNDFSGSLQFPSAGSQQVIVEGRFNSTKGMVYHGDCGSSTRTVNIGSSLSPPVLNEIVADLSSEEVTIKYNVQPYTLQVLEVQKGGPGSFVPVDTLDPESTTATVVNIDMNSAFFCYRIVTQNLCSGTKQASATLCTAAITGTAQASGNEVQYQTAASDSILDVNLLRDGLPGHGFGAVSAGSFTDANVNCQTIYTYAVKINYTAGTSITRNLSVTTANNGPLGMPENIVSFWEDNKFVFDVKLPSAPEKARFFAHMATGNTASAIIESDSSQMEFPSGGSNSCYRFSYIDGCGNLSSQGPAVCALFLYNTSTQPDELALNWNEYTGYKEGVAAYRLEKISLTRQVISVLYEGTATSYDLGQQPLEESGTYYKVSAIPSNPLLELSSSNIFHFQIVMEAYFPNAFTPNGDGKNDKFKVEGKFVSSTVLQIFNTWGELIYYTKDKESGWDGTLQNNSLAPQGTYIYSATIKTEDGKEQNKRGTVFLLRK